MTLSINQLRERVAQHFSDVQQVDESIIRCTRSLGQRDFAVYYLDIAERLPESSESLTNYQDRVIGRHYFEGKRSLQWNYYLYFVRSKAQLGTGEIRQQKDLIERDRTYARKFVIAEEDLESALTPPPVLPLGTIPRTSVLSFWIERLAEKGLERVILSNDDLPTRLELIESLPATITLIPKIAGKYIEVEAAQALRSFELKRYRRYPAQRSFDFSRVNLIFGVNGTGKTSLLEAIELFYCGRNARNPDSTPDYDLVGVLEDGNREFATNDRSLQLFRNRNLSWYGQPEIKTNNLYQSFAQFNFLDTDAAASLADSTSRIEEDLSKLLVGPDASKTWNAIERVSEAVSAQLRGLNTRWREATEELAVLTKQIADAGSIEKQSDALYAQVCEMTGRVQWQLPQDNKEAQAKQIVAGLSELLSVVQQAVSLGWIQPPSSFQAITKYRSDTNKNIEKAEAELSKLEISEVNQKRLGNEVAKQQETIELIREFRGLSEAGVSQRAKERAGLQSSVATHSGWLAGIDMGTLRVLVASSPEVSVAACHAAAVAKCTVVQGLLSRAKDEYADYSKLRDQSLKLSQQLRQVSERILQGSTNRDACPLCHTQFAPGDLARHIESGLDEQIESQGQEILSRMQEHERAIAEANDVETGAAWLVKFCGGADLSPEMSVRSVVVRLEQIRKDISDNQNRLSLLDAELRSLESRGLSMNKLEETHRRLRELGWSVDDVSPEALEQLNQTVTLKLDDAMKALDSESKNVSALMESIESILRPHISKSADLRVAFFQLKENLAITESVQTTLIQLNSNFPWPESSSLAELKVTADSVRNVATELQDALGKEKQAETNHADWTNRVERLKKRVLDLRERIDRLTNAKSTLEELQRNHSLKGAMEDALRRNRIIIEKIFGRIHAPAEFTGLGGDWATLRRKIDDSEAKLSEISTGQRAAFALSIFLAQNTQLTAGPPMILIDDPIAHVDDLNALSFLDYLREVALSDKRQIFFATASDKLATLFERKFDFLGEKGFRRFDLRRDELSS